MRKSFYAILKPTTGKSGSMSEKKKAKKKGANWGIPKNAKAYFDPHYDDIFKAKHPILYWLTVVAIIAIVMIGPTIYLLLCSETQSTMSLSELVFWIIGFVSSFGISIGFANLFMILHKHYLGHYVTLVSFLIGIVGSAISLFFIRII